jgi:hypothetical protein
MKNITFCSVALTVLLIVVLLPETTMAGDPTKGKTPYDFNAVFTDIAPEIDGYAEDIWLNAELIKGFTQLEPWPNEPSTELTGVRVLYDKENLYVLFINAASRPEDIVATTMARDGALNDDDNVEIYIDCLHDHRTIYMFATNPLGARKDVFISNAGATRREEWDGIWDVATQRTSQGWVAEFVIPFENLRFSTAEEQTWGINFAREIRSNGEESFWTPLPIAQGMRGMYNASIYAHMRGMRNISSGSRVQYYPFITGGITKEYHPGGTKKLREIGGDMKVNITSQMTADFTVNTDFAQIESDDEQVNLSRFSLFFPEKRDFFNEQAGLFEMGETLLQGRTRVRPPQILLFYSRRIGLVKGQQVDLLGGQRLTGKIGNYSIGVMNILTDEANLKDGMEPRTLYSVFRVRRNIFKRSSIGVMMTNKQAGRDMDDYNRGLGVDSRVYIGDNFNFSGALMRSFSPDHKSRTWAGNGSTMWRDDGYYLRLSTRYLGEDFNPEMGYIRRPNTMVHSVSSQIEPRLNWGLIREMGPRASWSYVSDTHGNLLGREMHFSYGIDSPRGDGIRFGYDMTFEHLPLDDSILDGKIALLAGDYRYNSMDFGIRSDSGRPLSGYISAGKGDFWHGNFKGMDAGVRLNTTGRLIVEADYERNDMSFPGVDGHIVTNLIANRITYSFSPALSTKLYSQYNDADDRLLFNFLLRWEYKPGSDFYLVYNEAYESLDLVNDPLLDNRDWHIRNRTAAAKLVYKF